MDQTLPPAISRDHFLGGKLMLDQPARGYRAGSDAVFLAAAIRGRPGQTVLDLGCGVGTAGLCLLRRQPDLTCTGLDIQDDLITLARNNGVLNRLDDRFSPVAGSLLSPPPQVPPHHFDHVITNPPWYRPGTVTVPETGTKAIGYMEEVELGLWLKQAVRFLKPRGRLAVVHRADRLDGILAGLSVLKLGEIRVLPLWPKPDRPAVRVVVTARKDAATPLEILPGLVLHHPDGSYTPQALAILMGDEGLP